LLEIAKVNGDQLLSGVPAFDFAYLGPATLRFPSGQNITRAHYGLEERLKRLNLEVMENNLSRTERNRIEAEIRAVNLVLQHFRTALELEEQLQPS
jgi:hypothetical protein